MTGIFILIGIILRIFLGVVAYKIALKNGKDSFGWFFLGFFLGIIGLIIIRYTNFLSKNYKLKPQDVKEINDKKEKSMDFWRQQKEKIKN